MGSALASDSFRDVIRAKPWPKDYSTRPDGVFDCARVLEPRRPKGLGHKRCSKRKEAYDAYVFVFSLDRVGSSMYKTFLMKVRKNVQTSSNLEPKDLENCTVPHCRRPT